MFMQLTSNFYDIFDFYMGYKGSLGVEIAIILMKDGRNRRRNRDIKGLLRGRRR